MFLSYFYQVAESWIQNKCKILILDSSGFRKYLDWINIFTLDFVQVIIFGKNEAF